jgi:hypothetical protein
MTLKNENKQQLCGGSPGHGRGFIAVLLMHLFLSFVNMRMSEKPEESTKAKKKYATCHVSPFTFKLTKMIIICHRS